MLLAAAAVVFLVGIGGGTYLAVGRPALAVRALEGTNTRELNGVIALLVRRVHQTPGDPRGWALLGKAYLTVGDGDDSAKAFARAIALTEAARQPNAELYSAYGEALTRTAMNAVPPEAEAAFAKALSLDPEDQAARYYLGMTFAARGENAKAIALWQSLIADAPPNAPWRQELVDRIATLTASSGAAPPDIGAMVAGLAARLKQNPDDPAGWQRLVRAYRGAGRRRKSARRPRRCARRDGRECGGAGGAVGGSEGIEAGELKIEFLRRPCHTGEKVGCPAFLAL